MTPHHSQAQASLLYTGATAPIDAIDLEALRCTLQSQGAQVREVRAEREDLIRFSCNGCDIFIAGFDHPFQMEHFRGVVRPDADHARQQHVLATLAGHGASLTVLVLDAPGRSVDFAEKARICRETVDLMLTATSPDLVFWSDLNELVTADEAEAALEDGVFDIAARQAANLVRPQHVARSEPPMTLRPAGVPRPQRPGDIDLGITRFETAPFEIRPKRPAQTVTRTSRPEHLFAAPDLSADVRSWLEGAPEVPEDVRVRNNLAILRSFLALDDSPEPRRVADTAMGRASIYLMSATIAVFVLPVGAAALTYNALSGGSFRVTSHIMALTGLFSALAAAGMSNPAAALGF